MLEPGWPKQLLTAGGSVGSRVARLCALCTEGLDVSGASLQVIATPPHRVTVHATDPVAERLDDLQQELGEGPAVDVARTNGRVLEPDLAVAGASRWPWFAPAAVAADACAVFAWPVQVGATSIGLLDLYRRWPGPLPDEDLADAGLLADAAAIVLLDDHGLGSADALVWVITDVTRFRPEVHQATGMLTVQLHLDLVDAFARLCAAAYADGRPMVEVARDIVARRLRLDST
jgi:ANTAR domain